jgi:hypothetical protein
MVGINDLLQPKKAKNRGIFMKTTNRIAGGINRNAQKAEYSPVMEALTRIGYGARGLIYIMMGYLAVKVALGKGGALATPQQAIAAIGKSPAGLILLWVILVGIVAYSLWGLVRAILDPLHKGHDAKGLFARFGFLWSAISYAILAVPTYGYIRGISQSSSGAQTQKLLTSIMKLPWGRYAIDRKSVV